MKKIKWQIKIGILLVILSAVLYFIKYTIFHDAYNMVSFLLEDLAFIPINVLVVTLIIDKVIEKREKETLIQKLNTVIGLFFTEVGTEISKICSKLDPNLNTIRSELIIKVNWTSNDFNKVLRSLKTYDYHIVANRIKLEEIKVFLMTKRDFLIRLLENPNLLEHETFTDLLMAVFHLEEELQSRDLSKLSEEDKKHLESDIVRIYKLIILEWVQYLRHLKEVYPYLFVTTLANNPFDLRIK